jgi:hypothetical protein
MNDQSCTMPKRTFLPLIKSAWLSGCFGTVDRRAVPGRILATLASVDYRVTLWVTLASNGELL